MPVVVFVDRNGFFWPENSANRSPEVVLSFHRSGQQLELVSTTGNASINVRIPDAKAWVMKKAA